MRSMTVDEALDFAARDAKSAKDIANLKKKEKALSIPITNEDIAYHSQFLEAVNYGGGLCWIYTRKSTGGRTGTYAKLRYHGVWVRAHRFALAVKLGCTLWDLELECAKVGHAKVSSCMGGRCCKHVHLRKEKSTASGAWQRSRDKKDVGNKRKRSAEEIARLVRYTCCLPISDFSKLKMGVNVIGEGDSAFTITLI